MRRMLLQAVLVIGTGVLLESSALAQAAAVERGQKVFADQKCSLCHSIGGVGNTRGALDGVGSRLSEADTRQWIAAAPEMAAKAKAERRPAMKAYPNLPPADVDALVVYMQSLKK